MKTIKEKPILKEARPCWYECSCGWKGPRLATWVWEKKPRLLFCGGCKESSLPNAGGTARELAALDSDNSNDING